jgi:hypothetical protein
MMNQIQTPLKRIKGILAKKRIKGNDESNPNVRTTPYAYRGQDTPCVSSGIYFNTQNAPLRALAQVCPNQHRQQTNKEQVTCIRDKCQTRRNRDE